MDSHDTPEPTEMSYNCSNVIKAEKTHLQTVTPEPHLNLTKNVNFSLGHFLLLLETFPPLNGDGFQGTVLSVVLRVHSEENVNV